MITVPGFLLRRLYVKGSLRNNASGFTFHLKNSLGSGYATAMTPLKVDGRELPLESCFFSLDQRRHPFTAVTEGQPFTLAMNRVTVVTVEGMALPPGPHKIEMGFVVPGLGRLSFDVVDEVGG